jgi:hypothetical protein
LPDKDPVGSFLNAPSQPETVQEVDEEHDDEDLLSDDLIVEDVQVEDVQVEVTPDDHIMKRLVTVGEEIRQTTQNRGAFSATVLENEV